MGFALTVVYIAAAIISPEQFGPTIANYHPLLYLAGITFLFSLPGILANIYSRSSIQTFLLLGFVFAIALSEMANGWIGGILASWREFLPSAAVFFFIVANVTTVRRLKILTLVSVATCLVVVVEAFCGYYGGFRGDLFVSIDNILLINGEVRQLARLRGAGFLNDPNDLAQMLLIALPLIFFAWPRRRAIASFMMVLVPAATVLWAVYLTHSRGASIALAILTLMVTRKRLGTTTSAILIAALVVGMLALQFTGGRGISAADGAGRLEAWANGLEMFKSAPLFGVGFGRFTDFHDITAHNSFVLCLAELGLVGSTIWIALLVTTLMSLNDMIGHTDEKKGQTTSLGNTEQEREATFLGDPLSSGESLAVTSAESAITNDAGIAFEPAELSIIPRHWVAAMRIALVAFVTTAWFLSRSYTLPLYLVLGLATAMIALRQSAADSYTSRRWVFLTLAVEVSAILCVYGMVRL